MSKQTVRQTRAERAAAWFALYAQHGSRRSLNALYATGIALGLRIGRNTLRKYSVDFGWQAQVEAYDAERAAPGEAARTVKAIESMNDRQAALGKAAQVLAAKAFDALAGKKDAELTPADAIRLARDGQRIERLAMGEATTRSEILVTVYSRMVFEIVDLFSGINDLADPAERKRRFALGVDGIVDNWLDSNGSPQLIEAR